MSDSPFPNRTQIPNIIDDLGLNPYERALYVHYKRVCGENSAAYCYETVKTTAHKLKMSDGQISETRRALERLGLILVQDGRPVIVTVVNIWEVNTAFYQLENRPDIEGWTIIQVREWIDDIHHMNVSEHKDVHTVNVNSPGECSTDDVHHMNVGSDMSTYIHKVKQRSKETLIDSNPKKDSVREGVKANAPPAVIPSFKIFVEITEYPKITKYWRNEMARIVGETPEDLEFWRRVVIGWTGKYPTKHNVEGMLDYYKRREIPGYQNGGSTNGTYNNGPKRNTDPNRIPSADPYAKPALP